MDLQMEGRDGIETTKAIRSLENSQKIEATPIIAVTADELLGDKERCLEAGMDDYIAKPITLPTLKEKLESNI